MSIMFFTFLYARFKSVQTSMQTSSIFKSDFDLFGGTETFICAVLDFRTNNDKYLSEKYYVRTPDMNERTTKRNL